MKTYKPGKHFVIFIIGLILFVFTVTSLTSCKGNAEIFDIIDSVENCSAPYVVYFYAEAEHGVKDLKYTWDFGDGETSSEFKPVHIYEKPGIYKVNLSVVQNKASDSKSKTLYLTGDSTVVFSDWDYASKTDSLFMPAFIEFQNYSKYATSFLWEFGDGETSEEKNPSHIYENQGTYTCLLNAICNGDTSKFSKQITIKPPPDDILIDEVTVWLPDTYLGEDVFVVVWYAGHEEKESRHTEYTESFPVTFSLTHNLYWFDGIYNRDILEFEIWSSKDNSAPVVTFRIESRDLQSDFYPSVISFDDGYGRKLEALLEYR
ncbi:MAG: PKD domain-containing protein [Chlorobi bacterium]|nr:PKD domain-containing protein [Chlorobiota bacterium]